jgi:hypothetical protein
VEVMVRDLPMLVLLLFLHILLVVVLAALEVVEHLIQMAGVAAGHFV